MYNLWQPAVRVLDNSKYGKTTVITNQETLKHVNIFQLNPQYTHPLHFHFSIYRAFSGTFRSHLNFQPQSPPSPPPFPLRMKPYINIPHNKFNKKPMGHIANLNNSSHFIVNNLHMKYQLYTFIPLNVGEQKLRISHFFSKFKRHHQLPVAQSCCSINMFQLCTLDRSDYNP